MAQRFSTRPAPSGFRVVDLQTGETAVIAMTPQERLSQEDAAHTAELLNRRAENQLTAGPAEQSPR